MASAWVEKAFPTFANRGKNKPGKGGGKKAKAGAPASKPKEVKPRLPQVDLLPPKLVLQVRRRQLRFAFLVAGMVAVILLTLAYLFQTGRATIETSGLTLAEQSAAAAAADLERYQPVTTYLAAAAERETLVQQIVTSDVPYQATLTSLETGLPGGKYQTISIKPNPAAKDDAAAQLAFVDACGPKTDPFSTETAPTAACVNIAGTAPDRAALNGLALALRSNPANENVYLVPSSTTSATSGVSFQGSFTVLVGAEAVQ